MKRRPFQAAALALIILAPALSAQEKIRPPQEKTPPTEEKAPPPQELDWYKEQGIPAVSPWGQALDTAYAREILSWTTMPEYTNPVVDHLPYSPSVVSPRDHFGYAIGKPGVLHHVDEIYGYFGALAASTDRVRFQLLGETEEGRKLALAQVGSAENLARLDEIKAGLNALADPRGTDAEEAARIIREIPAIYTFYGGLHSPETGAPEMVMEMAYRLAVSDDPMIQEIRDEVVVFIVPVAEPDGRDRVVDWHARYNADTYFTEDSKGGPPYWGKYIFHDNNRDGLQLSARLTQELVKLFMEWKYPVGHDLHESVPYLYVSTGTGPYNPTVDPITISEWQWMSNFEVTSLTAQGMPGVWTHGFYTGWYPGYLLWVTNTRNAVGRFYETFGNSYPNTVERELGESRTSVKWYRPSPPRETTLWSLRNNTNYMQTGSLAALRLVAQNRAMFLENYWKKANNSLNKGKSEAPYAYLIPAGQERKADAAYMVNLLMRQGLEIHRATEDGTFGEMEVREGDYVLRMDQPYRNYALTLMEEQEFPADAPAPYDDVAWTFPYMFNVTTHKVDDPAVQSDLEMEMVAGPVSPEGEIRGRRGDFFLVEPNASAHLMKARLALGSTAVSATEAEVAVNDEMTVAPGAWVLDADDQTERWIREQGFTAHRVRAGVLEDVPTHELDMPRIALLHTWTRTQDEGWARFTLDQQGVEYDYVGEDKIGHIGDLRARYDVILFPHQGGRNTAKRIFQGRDPEDGPMPYTQTPEFPTHGFPDSTEDMTGGMGFEGLTALRDFVESGGTFLAIGSASTLLVDYGFMRGVDLRDAGSVFVPGSILQGEVSDSSDPLTYGYGETFPLYHQYGPYFTISDDKEEGIAVTYASGSGMLLSGIARDAESLGEQPAVYSQQVGEGFIVVYGFDALHRHQNHGMLLAMLGMAVGTGNIWRFPRIAASNGGGSFLVAWAVFLLLWSVPLLILEFGMGKGTRKGTIGAFAKTVGPKLGWMGAWVAWTATAIMFYYSVVMGWTIRFFWATLTREIPTAVPDAFWNSFSGSSSALLTHVIAMGLAVFVVSRGVKGIEQAAKILIPSLIILVIVLALKAITLPGASRGLAFLFTPNFADLANYRIWLEALTQNAWDTGAGWGLALTYAVYMRQTTPCPSWPGSWSSVPSSP